MADLTSAVTGSGRIESASIQADTLYGSNQASSIKPAINIAVQPIDNGFIARMSFGPHVVPKEIFISTLEDLPDVLTAQIAANKIGV